jgi:hypothetical protein
VQVVEPSRKAAPGRFAGPRYEGQNQRLDAKTTGYDGFSAHFLTARRLVLGGMAAGVRVASSRMLLRAVVASREMLPEVVVASR